MPSFFHTFSLADIGLFMLGCITLVCIGMLIGYLFNQRKESTIREDAIKRSKSVILGESYEKIAPLLKEFKYHPRDAVFVGKGVDFVIFDGLSEGNLKKIIFMEVKTGKSALTKNERFIKSIVESKQVSYEQIRL